MRAAVLTSVLIATLVGCSSDPGDPQPAPPLATATEGTPVFDPEAPPALGVMALVPGSMTDLAVSDYEQVRLDLGVPDLEGTDPRAASDRFWARAERTTSILGDNLLREVDDQLASEFGWTSDDVDWQALFGGPEGTGWVLKIRDDLPMGDVSRAVEAGVGPLAGAVVVAEQHLVTRNAEGNGDASWAADPELTALAGAPSPATFVSRTCVAEDTLVPEGELAPTLAGDVARLDELGPFSLTLGSELATAQLGLARGDAFSRLGLPGLLPATDPDFDAVFVRPVADPGGGRLGWEITDAAAAADLTLRRQLPFAVCGG